MLVTFTADAYADPPFGDVALYDALVESNVMWK